MPSRYGSVSSTHGEVTKSGWTLQSEADRLIARLWHTATGSNQRAGVPGSAATLQNGGSSHLAGQPSPHQPSSSGQAEHDESERRVPASRAAASIMASSELAVHLYALHLLERNRNFGGTHGPVGLVGVFAAGQRRDQAVQFFKERIHDILDGAAVPDRSYLHGTAHEGLSSTECVDRGGEGYGEAVDERAEMEAGQRAMDALWAVWPQDGKSKRHVSAAFIDLMLPPFASHSRFLAHPLVSLALALAWRRGLVDIHNATKRAQTSSTMSKIHHAMKKAITPRRVHLFHLFSYVVLVALCTYVALRPGRWVTPYEPDDDPLVWTRKDLPTVQKRHGRGRPRLAEAAAGVWIVAHFWSAFHIKPQFGQLLLLAPLYLAVLTDYFSRQLTFALLTLALPLLYTLLFLPYYPSLPLLLAGTGGDPRSAVEPYALLLSCQLAITLRRFFRPVLFLSPIILLLFTILSWSLNGDIWRLNTIPVLDPGTGTFSGGGAVLEARSPLPIESGVAPFQTRLALLSTLVLFILYAIVLGLACSGRNGANTTRHLGSSSRIAASLPERYGGHDPLVHSEEAQFNSDVALLARQRLAQAVMLGLGNAHVRVSPWTGVGAAERRLSSEVGRDRREGDIEQAETSPLLAETGQESTVTPTVAADDGPPLPVRDRRFDPFVICPVPLNQVFDILEIAHFAVLGLSRRDRWKDRSHSWAEKVQKVGEWIAVWLVGPLCMLLAFLNSVWDRRTG